MSFYLGYYILRTKFLKNLTIIVKILHAHFFESAIYMLQEKIMQVSKVMCVRMFAGAMLINCEK